MPFRSLAALHGSHCTAIPAPFPIPPKCILIDSDNYLYASYMFGLSLGTFVFLHFAAQNVQCRRRQELGSIGNQTMLIHSFGAPNIELHRN